MIKKQMKQMDSEKDYLRELPLPKVSFLDSQWCQSEIRRALQVKEEKEKGITFSSAKKGEPETADTQMTKSQGPDGEESYVQVAEPEEKSVQAFEAALEKSQINLETQKQK